MNNKEECKGCSNCTCGKNNSSKPADSTKDDKEEEK